MGIGKIIKKAAKGTVKVAGSIALGTVGTASSMVEYLGAGSNIEIMEQVGHGLKSASFNGVRKIWGADAKEYGHGPADAGKRKAGEIRDYQKTAIQQKEREIERLEKSGYAKKEYVELQRNKVKEQKDRIRRTDEELSKDVTGLDRNPRDFQIENNVPLSRAVNIAKSEPGVYILWLDGFVMKCGRASYNKSAINGVQWRLRQYYNLNYDDRARKGEYWSVTEDNKDDIIVSWQCCPISKCHELEYKLFQKYGKGPWAHRAPTVCNEDSWELLI